MTKKTILAEAEELSTYDLEGTLDEAKKFIEDLIKKHGGNANLKLEIYSGGEYHFAVYVRREETDKEYAARVKQETEFIKRNEKYQREQYEALKKKFG